MQVLLVLFAALVIFPVSHAFANAGITYHGRLLDPSGTPVEAPNVQFRLQIRTPGNTNCLLYEETHLRDLTGKRGAFSITMNDGNSLTPSPPPYSLVQAFENRGTFNFGPGRCTGDDQYTPSPTDGRVLAVAFDVGTGWEQLPPQTINFVPMALEAVRVGGYRGNQLFRVDDAGVPQVLAPWSLADYTKLTGIVTGTEDILGSAAGFTGSLGGDVTGSQNSTQVTRLQGRPLSSAAPADGQALVWSQTNNRWEPGTVSGGGGGGSTDWADITNKPTTFSPGPASGGDVTGTYPLLTIENNAVTSGKIADGAVSFSKIAAGSASGQVLRYNGTSWSPTRLDYGDLVNSFSASPWPGACSTGQVVTWSSVSDSFSCISLTWAQIASGTPTTVSGYGITDAVINAGSAPSLQSGLDSAKPAAGVVGRLYVSTDTREIFRDDGAAWVRVAMGTAGGGGSVTFPLLADDGTGANPAYSFSAEPGLGFFRRGANGIGISLEGWEVAAFQKVSTKSIFRGHSALTGTAQISLNTIGGASPPYAFWLDDDTGMGRLSADTLALSTAGLARMVVGPTGNVGIGTLTPGGPLDVQGGTAGAGVSGTSISLYAQNGGTGNTSGGDILLVPGESTGTGTPGRVRVGAGGTTSGIFSLYHPTNGSPASSGTVDASVAARIQNLDIGANSSGDTWLQSRNPSNLATNRNLILQPNGGNLGIGISNPTAKLTIDAPTGVGVAVRSNGGIELYNFPNTASTFMGWSTSSEFNIDSPQVMRFDSNQSIFATSGSERMRIDASGNIGVGTASPTARLEVAGQVKITGGSPGVGRVLTSDGTGLATWETPASGGISALTGDVTASGAGSVAATISNNAVNSAKIADGSVGVGDLDFAGAMLVNTGLVVRNGTQFHNKTCASDETLIWSVANGWICGSPTVAETDPKVGANTTDYLSKWNGSALVSSGIFENALGNVGVGTASPTEKLDVAGNIKATQVCIGADCRSAWPVAGDFMRNGSVAMTGAFRGIAGTATAPGISFDGDTDTGMYRPAANQLGFSLGTKPFMRFAQTNGRYRMILENTWNSPYPQYPHFSTSFDSDGFQMEQCHNADCSSLTRVFRSNGTTAAIGGSLAVGWLTTPNLVGGSSSTVMHVHALNLGNNAGVHITTPSTGSTVSDGIILMQDGTTQAVLGTYEAQPLQIRTTGADRVTIAANGNVGIGLTSPTYQLQLSTDSAAKPGTSTWTVASDERLKDIRAPFTRGLDAITGLETVYFHYKRDNPLGLPSEKEYVGIKAQDAQREIPESVRTDERGYLHVTNDSIIWTAVNAIKELYRKFLDQDALIAQQAREIASKADKAEIEALRAKNKQLEERLEKIEKSLQSK